jgi:LacI family transcriptional regulator
MTRKKKKATIHDISKALGFNSSTVSRALNDSPLIADKTKKIILEKSKELGYQRNSLASKLRTNKTKTIGVIVPRIARHFCSSVIAGIEEMAFDKGYDVIICQSLETVKREKKLLDTLLANRVDGVLIAISMETTNFDHLENYKNEGFPLLFFDRPCDIEGCTNVVIDDFKASFDATEHLIRKGCKNIVHFSGPKTLALYRNRWSGYRAALEKNNIPLNDNYIFESKLMEKDGVIGAQKILSLPEVDGVFSANDTTAISAMQYLKKNGKNVPEDIAFVGFNNEPMSAVFAPSLTTIHQPGFEMGRMASSLLFEEIDGTRRVKGDQVKVLNSELIIRDSTSKHMLSESI